MCGPCVNILSQIIWQLPANQGREQIHAKPSTAAVAADGGNAAVLLLLLLLDVWCMFQKERYKFGDQAVEDGAATVCAVVQLLCDQVFQLPAVNRRGHLPLPILLLLLLLFRPCSLCRRAFHFCTA
jgi:hypothetical protein